MYCNPEPDLRHSGSRKKGSQKYSCITSARIIRRHREKNLGASTIDCHIAAIQMVQSVPLGLRVALPLLTYWGLAGARCSSSSNQLNTTRIWSV